MFVPLLHWTGVYVGPAPWLILAVAEAAFLAGLGAVLPVVQRLRAAPVWIGCAWVLQEALRDRLPFGGFPWGRLAFSQAASPLRWFAALGGAPLVTFAVAVGGGALGVGVLTARRSSRRLLAGLLAAAVAVPVVGLVLAWPLNPGHDGADRTVTIALIQGSVPERGLAFEDRARQVLDNHVAQTLKLAAAGQGRHPAATGHRALAGGLVRRRPVRGRRGSGRDRLGGQGGRCTDPGRRDPQPSRPDPPRERGHPVVADERSRAAMYLKRHPVPFGEYIPLRGLAKLVSSDVNLVTQDMVGGTGNGLLDGRARSRLGDVICFEVAYDSLVRSSVRAGAQLVVVQTNNATFGHTAETYQQLAMSRLRAVETGRTVAQVATTGLSARDRSGRLDPGTVGRALFTPAIVVVADDPADGHYARRATGSRARTDARSARGVAFGWAPAPGPAKAGRRARQVTDEEMVST